MSTRDTWREREPADHLADYEFPSMLEEFISNFHASPDVKNLRDIIAWNEMHSAEALPERRLDPLSTTLPCFTLLYNG